jgi:hypothetical protein
MTPPPDTFGIAADCCAVVLTAMEHTRIPAARRRPAALTGWPRGADFTASP